MSSKATTPMLKVTSVLLRVAIGAAVLLVGTGIALTLVATKPSLPPRAEGDSAALVVGTVPATRTDVDRVWSGYGTARAMNSANLAAEVPGRIVDRPANIEPGNRVAAGDLIVQIEQTDFLARARAADQFVAQALADLESLKIDEAAWQEQLEIAEEQAAIERRELSQAYAALERGAATPSEIDRRTKALRALEAQVSTIRQQFQRVPSRRATLEATLDRARADADVAKQNVRRTAITAPFDGVLESVSVESDEFVNVGAPIARLVDISRIEVPLKIPASALGYVRVGDAATLRPDGPATHSWPGTVGRISPEADPGSRSITVFIEVTQDAAGFQSASHDSTTLLLPGQFVVCTITGAPETDRLLVPRRAVQDGVLYVAVPNDRGSWTARKTDVRAVFHTTGSHPDIDAIEQQWTVLDTTSIPDDAPIIVTNLDVMIDGRIVSIASRAAAADPASGDPR